MLANDQTSCLGQIKGKKSGIDSGAIGLQMEEGKQHLPSESLPAARVAESHASLRGVHRAYLPDPSVLFQMRRFQDRRCEYTVMKMTERTEDEGVNASNW